MVKTKKEETKFNEDKTLLATVEQGDTVAYGLEMDFMKSPEEQKKIIQDIEEYVDNVKAQREELRIEQEWKDTLDLHDGTVDYKDFPYEGCHNLHVHITAMTDNILIEKAKRRTFVRPMMLMRAKPGKSSNYAPGTAGKKEKWYDYRIHTDIDIEEDLSPIYSDAIILGTGFGKIIHNKIVDTVREIEIYDGSDREKRVEEIQRFVTDFGDEKGKPEYKENHNKLMNGEVVEVWVEKEEVVKYCPEIKHVDPFNLYIDCYEKDLRLHRIIPEKIPNVTWQELNGYFNSGYFTNKEVLRGIRERYKGDKEYRKMKYNIWECNYMYLAKKGKEIRAIVTYIEEYPEQLARGISFPYLTRCPNYEIYTIIDGRNRIYGVGIPKLLKDTNIAINELWNLTLDATEYDVAPMLKARKNSGFDPTRKGAVGPAVVQWLDNPTEDLQYMQRQSVSNDVYKGMEYLIRYAEWISGVSAYMSGRESPTDPHAPASKAYMLLQESNIRINAYIRKIDKANKRLCYQIDRLYYQFFDESIKAYGVEHSEQYAETEITRKEIGMPVEYLPQLSDITINKSQEREDNLRMAEFLLKMPMVANFPSALRTIIEIQLRSAGGEWDKHIDKLLPDEKETDVMTKLMTLLKEVGPDGIMQMLQQLGAMSSPQLGGGVMPPFRQKNPAMPTGANPAEGRII